LLVTPAGITQEQIVRVVGFVDRALVDLKHLEPAFDIHHL
jgi:pyruvate-formate lyase-activating enzyme